MVSTKRVRSEDDEAILKVKQPISKKDNVDKASDEEHTGNASDSSLNSLSSDSGSDSDSDDDKSIVNVDFEFFDPSEIDYHGIKSLLSQTFSNDAALFNLGEVADLIIKQNYIGSTVKCDGPKSDPYAVVSLINIQEHKKDCKALGSICDYLSKKATAAKQGEEFSKIINSNDCSLLINERLINMPPQIVPPLLKMMNEELESDSVSKKPSTKNVIYISKVYQEVESTLEEKDGVVTDSANSKKSKKKRAANKKEEKETPLFYFQAEDELLEQKAKMHFKYRFTNTSASADSKRAFQDAGIAPLRKVFVLPVEVLSEIIPELEEALN